jgi:hypothetical protein
MIISEKAHGVDDSMMARQVDDMRGINRTDFIVWRLEHQDPM